jgi:uncharacterized protein YggU (UPF0235/DUF167 family)
MLKETVSRARADVNLSTGDDKKKKRIVALESSKKLPLKSERQKTFDNFLIKTLTVVKKVAKLLSGETNE